MLNYYSEEQYIAELSLDGNIIGQIEKWKAHENGILHKGFTIIIAYEDNICLQSRKHPVFDGYIDMTISSHPLFLNDKLEEIENALFRTLLRECGLERFDILKSEYIHTNTYKAKHDLYIEHEMCDFYFVRTKKRPMFFDEIAYGGIFLPIDKIISSPIKKSYAPWISKSLDENLYNSIKKCFYL